MKPLIALNCNGIDKVSGSVTYRSEIDTDNSRVFASSLYCFVNEKGNSVATPKDSDDKIVIGYSEDGLPFMIVVDGFYGCDRNLVFSFIDNKVIPLMEEYWKALTTSTDATAVTKSLIRNIYRLHAETGHVAEFTMSIAMCYSINNQQFCAGFGIGDTAICLKRHQSGRVEQLVCHTEVDGFKDAFDRMSADNQTLVISRNTLFKTRINPGDEIVGYTFLPEGFEQESNIFLSENLPIRHLNLNLSEPDSPGSLFTLVKDASTQRFEAQVEKAKGSEKAHRFGDDFTLGGVIVPDAELRRKLQFILLYQQCMSAIENSFSIYLKSHWIMRMFSAYPSSASYIEILKLMASNSLVCVAIICSLFQNILQNQLSQEVISYLGFETPDSAIGFCSRWLKEEIDAAGFNSVEIIRHLILTIIDKLNQHLSTQPSRRMPKTMTDELEVLSSKIKEHYKLDDRHFPSWPSAPELALSKIDYSGYNDDLKLNIKVMNDKFQRPSFS